MKNRNFGKRLAALGMAAVVAFSLAACGGSSSGSGTQTGGQTGSQAQTEGQPGEKIVNVGVTNTLGTLNPLLMDGGEVNKYATGLMFLPLVELDADLNFEGMLADSITAEDTNNFLVHINPEATWSDGQPVTADDVLYTALKLTSPVIGNTAMMYYAFEGVGDDGFTEQGADHIEGIVKVDFSDEELTANDWFNHPDVVSGPFMVTDYDQNHYISYTANENYWKGAPKIDKLNIRIVEGSQLYAGLSSGEIDVAQQTMSAFPVEDYESVEALENVEAVYGDPVTNQSVFIRTQNLQDARVRQAMLCAIDRQQILDQLLKGHGEVIDGFLSSISPYFDETITPVSYDPDRAKSLLEEAGWDSSQTLKFYINSGDSTFVNAAAIIVAQWAAVGINAQIQTVDFATLMDVATRGEFDVLAVQYTYAPVDPYADVAWLLGGEESWTGYTSPEVEEALAQIPLVNDTEDTRELYSVIDQRVQEDVPMFSAYVISSLGAVNKRLTGVTPTVYGFFNHVEQWDVAE